jgi:hypothetical protein
MEFFRTSGTNLKAPFIISKIKQAANLTKAAFLFVDNNTICVIIKELKAALRASWEYTL